MSQKRVALVVGGSGGIGRAVVRQFLCDGFAVWATAHNHPAAQDGAQWLSMDVTNAVSVKDGIDKLFGTTPMLDVLVYSVSAPVKHIPVLDLTWQAIEAQLLPQLQGMVHLVGALKPQLLARSPIRFVIVLSDVIVGKPPQGLGHYAAAKAALASFAKSMAVELAPFGATVNCVAPGMVETELVANFPTRLVQASRAANPLRRLATADDVAAVVAFLASPQASYLNGVIIPVNGGSVV